MHAVYAKAAVVLIDIISVAGHLDVIVELRHLLLARRPLRLCGFTFEQPCPSPSVARLVDITTTFIAGIIRTKYKLIIAESYTTIDPAGHTKV